MTGDAGFGSDVYRCDIHGLEFEERDWCPQCEIEFEVRASE